MDAAHAFFIPDAKYSTEKGGVDEIRTRDRPFCHAGSDTMSKDQLNQKFKLVVGVPRIDLHSVTTINRG